MRKEILAIFAITLVCAAGMAQNADKMQYPPENAEGYELVWSDEFNYTGAPDPAKWSFEDGFLRNEELQWYQPQNAHVADGVLKITARKEKVKNKNYKKGSKDWRESRKTATCTSSSINTKGKFDFTFGHVEVRAKVPTQRGAWSGIWTMGTGMPWASCGEIDIMECYHENEKPSLVANVIHGNDNPWQGVSDGKLIPLSYFEQKDKNWTKKFHVWTLDWDKDHIIVKVDGELVKQWDVAVMKNGSIGSGTNPFLKPQYFLLNLAVSGSDNDKPRWKKKRPMELEVDYIRVYQEKQTVK